MSLHVERVPTAGRFNIERIVQQVNQADLHPLAILIREFAQNSWDARSPDTDRPVRFEIDGFELNADQRMVLTEDVFTDLEDSGVLGLRRILKTNKNNKIRAIVLSDWETVGLGGVTDPRQVDPSGKSAWSSYLHDIGSGQSEAAGHGGRYGMGRTSAYGVSKVKTIVVYTRTRDGESGREQSRLVAVSIGGNPTAGSERLTGRVWWGKIEDDLAEPIVGMHADRIARDIGFKPRREGELGLSVMVIDPSYTNATGEGTFEESMELIAESVLWNLWPKFVTNARSMEIVVRLEGHEIPIPDPSDHPILNEFIELGAAVRRWGKPGRAKPKKIVGINCEPITYRKELLGYLALKAFVHPKDKAADIERLRQLGGITTPANHVLLMRSPELVVEYRSMKTETEEPFNLVGMFVPINESAIDEAFALAEPVAHDRWHEANIPEERSQERGYVKTTLRRIEQLFDSAVKQLAAQHGAETETEHLKRASRELSEHLLPRRATSKPREPQPPAPVLKTSAGQLVQTGARPDFSGGRFLTIWEAEWRPKQMDPGPVVLAIEVAPVGQSTNRVTRAERGGEVAIDRHLRIEDVTANGEIIQNAPEKVEIQLANPSNPSNIALAIERSETIGVAVKVSVQDQA